MGTGADTIGFTLTIQNVGSGSQLYALGIIPAGDPKAATVPYVLFINGDGTRSPTIAYSLNVIDVGVPTLSFALGVSDMHFQFSGLPPQCDVSSPFVILPAPVADNTPQPSAFRVTGPAVPGFTWQMPVLPTSASLTGHHQVIKIMGAAVQSMGDALNALRQQVQRQAQANKSPNKNNPQKPGDFTEQKGSRVTSKHRIFNPKDKEQYVDITQIDAITWQNQQGQKITWKR